MNLNDFDLNLLPVLRALLEERSVTRASKRVGLTQGATSAALARLRARLGDSLLLREGRQMNLTPVGRGLLQRLPRLLDELRAELASHQTERLAAERLWRVRMPDFVAATLVPPLLSRLGADGRLVVLPPTAELPVDEFERGELDLMIASRLPLPPSWMTRALYREDWLVLARPDHPVLKRWDLAAYVGADHALLSPRGGATVGAVDEALERLRLSRRVVLSVAGISALPSALLERHLLATVPRRWGLQVAGRWGLQALNPPFELPGYGVQMIWPSSVQRSAPHRWLRSQVIAAVAAATH
jgi:DNA-binding transcriptional LysR family regulator